MDALYTRAQATASRLLAKYNQANYELHRANPPIAAAESWEEPTPVEPTIYPLKGIGKNSLKSFSDGTTTITNVSELLFAVFDDEPKPGDVLTRDGLPLTVLDVKPVTDAKIGWRFVVKG